MNVVQVLKYSPLKKIKRKDLHVDVSTELVKAIFNAIGKLQDTATLKSVCELLQQNYLLHPPNVDVLKSATKVCVIKAIRSAKIIKEGRFLSLRGSRPVPETSDVNKDLSFLVDHAVTDMVPVDFSIFFNSLYYYSTILCVFCMFS